MESRRRPGSTGLGAVAKRIGFVFVGTLVLFAALEGTQRVRWSIKFHDPRWLLYGFLTPIEGFTGGVIRVRADNRAAALEAWTAAPAVPATEVRRIVAVGSSTTVGQFNDDLHRYPYLLGQALNRLAGAGAEYRVLNLGQGGATSEDYQGLLAPVLSRTAPNTVIFYTGFSDIFLKPVNRGFAEVSARPGSFWDLAEKRSLLLITVKERYIFWRVNRSQADLKDLRGDAELEEAFRSNIGECVRLLRVRGSNVVLIPEVLIAKRFGTSSADYAAYAAKYRNIPAILKDIAGQYGCEFLDLQSSFAFEDYQKYFVDFVHLTNAGNEVLSRLILERSSTLKKMLAGGPAD